MRKTKHCSVCQHATRDASRGIVCALTSDKPKFGKKCDRIDFAEHLMVHQIEKVTIEQGKVTRKKGLTMLNFFVFLGLSVAIVLSGYLLGSFHYDQGVLSTIPLVIIFIGLSVLSLAFGPFNKYKQEIGVANEKKKEIDDMLALYGIDYQMNLDIQKGVHDVLEVSSELELRKNGQPIGSYTNQQTLADKVQKAQKMPF